jgi:DNA-binding NtrC family response regulator
MRNEFPSKPVLVVDDEEQFLYSISLSLRLNGISNVRTCSSGAAAGEFISTMDFSAIVLDVNLPDIRGPELLDVITEQCPETPVVMITAVDKADVAVECMKKGALDYLVKPLDDERIISILRNAISQRELRGENEALKGYLLENRLRKPDVFSKIVTQNARMHSLFLYVEAISSTPFPVLVTGETGVGKELIAQAIHDLSGRKGPFIPVNVGGIDDNTFSDTLFGHTRGAFTGADSARAGIIERAAGGTLFLDEIGDLSKGSQVKLLRVLQNRDYLPLGSDVAKLADVRLIVATNKSIKELQDASEFRSDLFHRLKTHHIAIPPLRERMDDIPKLADYFISEASQLLNKVKPEFTSEVLSVLNRYDYPGNIRELRGILFDVMSIQESSVVSVAAIRERLGLVTDESQLKDVHEISGGEALLSYGSRFPTIQQAVLSLIQDALTRSNGNQNAAARLLGISPQALSRRLKYLAAKKDVYDTE